MNCSRFATLTRSVLAIAIAGWLGCAVAAQDGAINLAERNTLASLLDLAAERLDVRIEYPEESLRQIKITLRLGSGISDEELWSLVNRLLASEGWTTIEMEGDSVLSVVKLTEAVKHAKIIDPRDQPRTRAGFASAVLRVKSMDAAEALAVIQPLLSDPGGKVTRLGESDLLILSDLQPRLTVVLAMMNRLDQLIPEDEVQVERLLLSHADPVELVAAINAAVQTHDLLESRPLPGKLSAAVDGESVILVAPRAHAQEWRDLIAQFDRNDPVTARTYTPHKFAAQDVAELIEQSVPLPRGGSGDRWRMVHDELTGSLIITATQGEHERIDMLLARLDAAPEAARRGMRAFVVRNRDVMDMLGVLEQLVQDDQIDIGADAGGLLLPSSVDPADDVPSTPGTAPETGNESREPPMRSIMSSSFSITADEATSTLIAIGEPRLLMQLETLLQILDVRQPQVELEFLVISLSESDSLDLGVELQKLEISGSTLIGLSSLFGLADIGLDSSSPFTGGSGFSGIVLSPGDFSIVIRALRTLNEGSSRSYPKVLVNNNESATLDSVLQQPFSQINASDTVATTSFGEFVDAGTQVTVTPHIAEGDHLVLEYHVTLSAFVGESADPNLPPPRQRTSVQSVVTIPDGYAIAVGGLEILSEASAETRTPLLGDIPILGELFKNRSRSMSSSKFYVFIRANVLRHDGFEDLKYLSDRVRAEAGMDDAWPVLEPQIIR